MVYTLDFPIFLARVRGPSSGMIEFLWAGGSFAFSVASAGLEPVIADLGYLGSSGYLIPSLFFKPYYMAFLYTY